MHCVSIYPSPVDILQLNQIDFFKSRYPDFPIGWSTHEPPDSVGPVQIAVAKGAELFERHVGIETDTIKLNAYSSTPDQVDNWLAALNDAKVMCGLGLRPPSRAGKGGRSLGNATTGCLCKRNHRRRRSS